MCTKSAARNGFAIAIAALCIDVALAEKIQIAASIADNAAIDRALGALRAPVVGIIAEGERGAPIWPLYKQEIAKGQSDFRPKPKPIDPPPRRERRSSSPSNPTPVPPPPQPQPCTPNSPNWPNCLQQP